MTTRVDIQMLKVDIPLVKHGAASWARQDDQTIVVVVHLGWIAGRLDLAATLPCALSRLSIVVECQP